MLTNGSGYAKARFGKSTNAPSKSATGFKPLRYDPMVDVFEVCQSNQHIHVEEKPRVIAAHAKSSS
jgi:hypothetical protein